MKLTFVLRSAADSGGNRVIALHAQRLIARGHQVEVVSVPEPGQPLVRRLKNWVRGRPAPRPPPAGTVFDGTPVPHRVLPRFRAVVDGDVADGDIVIATWWETAYWIAGLSARKGTKVYFIQGHEATIPGQPPERVDQTWRLPFQKIVVSGWLAQLARVRFGDPGAILVANGVDATQYTSPPRGKQARPTVGFVYTPEPIKGSDLCLAAVAELKRRLPDLRLLAFGRSHPGAESGFPSWGEFIRLPSLAQVRETYAACDVWIFSSRVEGFGLPILEAMACRTPVVATPAGAAPELLAEGGGVVVAGLEPAGLADAAFTLLQLPEVSWEELSQQALAVALRHTWDQAADQFEAALLQTRQRASADRRGRQSV